MIKSIDLCEETYGLVRYKTRLFFALERCVLLLPDACFNLGEPLGTRLRIRHSCFKS